MRVRIEFLERAPHSTEVRIHQTQVPEPMRAPEAQSGFLTALDRFAAYLAGLAGRPDATPEEKGTHDDPSGHPAGRPTGR